MKCSDEKVVPWKPRKHVIVNYKAGRKKGILAHGEPIKDITHICLHNVEDRPIKLKVMGYLSGSGAYIRQFWSIPGFVEERDLVYNTKIKKNAVYTIYFIEKSRGD